MITLTFKLKKSEISDFSAVINVVRERCIELLSVDQYFHYYNLESLIKKCFDKQYSTLHQVKKDVTLKININEYKSFKYLYEIMFTTFQADNLIYYRVLVQKILDDLHLKEVNLIPPEIPYIS